MAGLLGLLVVTALFSGLGGILAQRAQWDDWARVAIGIFGVSPILLTIPIFGIVGQLLHVLIAAGITALTGSSNGSDIVAFLVNLTLAAFGVIAYKQKKGFGRLSFMTLMVSGLLSQAWVQTIAAWVVIHFGIPVWNGANTLFELLVSIPVHLG